MIFEGPFWFKPFCDSTTTSVRRNGIAKSNVSLKRCWPALMTAQIVKLSCFGWNTVKKHSQAVSIVVYEFQVMLKIHAINNILLLWHTAEQLSEASLLIAPDWIGNSCCFLPKLSVITSQNSLYSSTLNKNKTIFPKFFSRPQHE